ncbi:PASTA domain-containing protein [Zafaria sp. Z1313]
MIGRLIGGRYDVHTRVAAGGMATVYVATDVKLERETAIKVLHPHLSVQPEVLARFRQEAVTAARVSDVHVVNVLDHGVEDGVAYLAMEYVEGRTLREILRKEGPLPPRQALAYLSAIVAGLAAAHGQGLIHRDMKPENVLLSNSGAIKVADFGLARPTHEYTEASLGALATAAYVAPEIVNNRPADGRSDIYSVGIMLFELLTGRQPFTGDLNAVLYQHVTADVPAPSALLPGLALDLDELVLLCTARDPEDRLQDVVALQEELQHIRTTLSDAELDYGSGSRAAQHTGGTRPAGGAGVPGGHPTAALDPDSPPTEAIGAAGNPTEAIAPDGHATRAFDSFHDRTTALPSHRDSTRALPRFAPGDGGPAADDGGAEPGDADGGYPADDGRPGHGSPGRVGPHRLGSGSAAGTAPHPTARQQRKQAKQERRDWKREAQTPVVQLGRGTARRRGWIWAVVVVLLAALLGTAGWFFGAGPGAAVDVPRFEGRPVADAASALDGLGVDHSQREVFDEVLDSGLVVGSEPVGGTQIRRFQSVELLVSKGPELFTVPNLVGRESAQAEKALEDGQLAAGDVSERHDESMPAGQVVSQDPGPDEQVRRGTEVSFVVSQGPAPVDVPDVTGRTAEDAEQILRSAGLVGEDTGEEFSRTVPEGAVLSQQPAEGRLERGSTVGYVLSKGPRMVEVPNVRGRQLGAARAALEELGFTVEVTEGTFGIIFNTVATQDPAGGTELPEGSTVTLGVV